MSGIGQEILQSLFALQDLKYRDFQAKLMPTVDKNTIIGVRTPELRRLARQVAKNEQLGAFLDALPHTYYDENNLHGFLLCEETDFAALITRLDAFLPYVDNWATCDLMRPKAFARHKTELLPHIRRWLAAKETYTVRFAMEMLMTFYLDDDFSPEYLSWVAGAESGEYYVNMMIAWYFATALAKKYSAALPYLTEQRLGVWTHNKTIQKAVESDRITPEQKEYLKTLKRKERS